WFKVVGSTFAVLLIALGTPTGKKAEQDYEAPRWLEKAPLWQKRLFLAALFGAELTKPKTVTGHDTVFGSPTLSMNKREEHAESGHRFLETLSRWLAEFDVQTQAIKSDSARPSRRGAATVRLRLILSSESTSLLALWSHVGYEYNAKRSGLAALAV